MTRTGVATAVNGEWGKEQSLARFDQSERATWKGDAAGEGGTSASNDLSLATVAVI